MATWEESDDDVPHPTPSAPVPKKPANRKWEGEDEDDEEPVSDWEASSSSEDEKPQPAAPAAPPKKKGTLKAKLAEKEALKAAQAARGDDNDEDGDEEYDEDAVLNPRDKAHRDQERQIAADLNNAAELFGSAALGGTSSKELDWLISAQPRTKEDYVEFSDKIVEYIIKRHQGKPLYAAFLEHHVRQLALPLRDVEVRKVASGLTALSNEKQKEQRDKASGKKKPKTVAKPTLAATKPSSKLDTSAYEEELDDFGADDFM